MNTTPSPKVQQDIDACTRLFGEHPEDVISPIESAADALVWLEVILQTIVKEARAMHAPESFRLSTLVDAAKFIACDFGEQVGYLQEKMLERLIEAGAAQAGELLA